MLLLCSTVGAFTLARWFMALIDFIEGERK